MGGVKRDGLPCNGVRRTTRELNNGLLDIFAVDRYPVYFTETAILSCADIVRVRITPASLPVSFKCLAVRAIVFRTSANLPARNEGVDALYSLDAELLHCYRLPDTLEAINVCFGIPAMIRTGLVRCN